MAEGSALEAVRRALEGHDPSKTANTAQPVTPAAVSIQERILAKHQSLGSLGVSAMDTPISKTIAMLEQPGSATQPDGSRLNRFVSDLSACKAELALQLGQVRHGWSLVSAVVLTLYSLALCAVCHCRICIAAAVDLDCHATFVLLRLHIGHKMEVEHVCTCPSSV